MKSPLFMGSTMWCFNGSGYDPVTDMRVGWKYFYFFDQALQNLTLLNPMHTLTLTPLPSLK